MSWIGSLAGKAENLLNLVDQAAGQALQNEFDEPEAVPIEWHESNRSMINNKTDILSLTSTDYNRSSQYVSKFESSSEGWQKPLNIPSYGSVPVNLHHMNSGINDISSNDLSFNLSNNVKVETKSSLSSYSKTLPVPVKDKDEDLFDFLNSSRTVSPSSNLKTLRAGEKTSNRFRVVESQTPKRKSDDVDISLPQLEVIDRQTDVIKTGKLNNDGDELEAENAMLKNEILSLNQDMTSLIRRSQAAQDELFGIRQEMDRKSKYVQSVQELQTRISDMQELIRSKDTQLAIVKVRLEEASRDLEATRHTIEHLQTQTDRLSSEQQLTSNEQNVDSLKVQLFVNEQAIQQEQESHRQAREKLMRQLEELETEKQKLSTDAGLTQSLYHEEKRRNAELSAQLKIAKSLVATATQELNDYKDKATRILQSKERLISNLKEGSAGISFSDSVALTAELESTKQERDLLRDELHHSKIALETTKLEILELENQFRKEKSLFQERIQSFEDQLHNEKNQLKEVEMKLLEQKLELSKAHTDLQKQTSALQSRIDDRDDEIQRLRNQVTTKCLSSDSQEEKEMRLRSLTDSLIQKQTMLETISTERNSLILQLEKMEKQYREAESIAIRASASAINVSDHNEARHRNQGFVRESPSDSNFTRKVKHAANSVDRFSISIGFFLRRYPVARIFILLYIGLLHFWVMIVLMTYEQEVHSHSDYQPLPPGPI